MGRILVTILWGRLVYVYVFHICGGELAMSQSDMVSSQDFRGEFGHVAQSWHTFVEEFG